MNIQDDYYSQESLGELSLDEIKKIREIREERWKADGELLHKSHTVVQSCYYCTFATPYYKKSHLK